MNTNLKIYPNKYSDISYNTELFKTTLVSVDGRRAVIRLAAASNDPFLSPGMKGVIVTDDGERKLTIKSASNQNGWLLLECRLRKNGNTNR
jgi:hypothetical protein